MRMSAMGELAKIYLFELIFNKNQNSWIKKLMDAIENANKASQRKYLNESAQIILRSDSKNHLDMSKSVDLATIGQALIIQTKHLEECFQNSQKSLKNSEQSNSQDDEDCTMSINTLSRLVSQLTVSFAIELN